MKSGFINLDYFLLTLLACEFSPVVASVLFAVTYVLEFVRLLDALFYFSRRDPFYAVRFLGHIDKVLVFGWAAAFISACGLSLWLWRSVMPQQRGWRLWRPAVPIGVLLLSVMAFDQTQGLTLIGAGRHLRSENRAVDEVLFRVPLSVVRPHRLLQWLP